MRGLGSLSGRGDSQRLFQTHERQTDRSLTLTQRPRPDSRLFLWDDTPCDKFSLLQTSKHHLLYMKPGEEGGMQPNTWMEGFASGDVYLLKVKDPHGESLAYEPFDIPRKKTPVEQKQFWSEIAAELEIAMVARFRAAIGFSTVIGCLARLGTMKHD